MKSNPNSLCGPKSDKPCRLQLGYSGGHVFTVAVGRSCATLWTIRTGSGVLAGFLQASSRVASDMYDRWRSSSFHSSYVRVMCGYEDSKNTFYDIRRDAGRTLDIIGTVIPRELAHRSALFFSAVFCSSLELRTTVLISQDGPKYRLFPVPTSPTLRSSRCRTNRIKIEGGKRRGGGYCGDGDGG